jgi:hypothetical protein
MNRGPPMSGTSNMIYIYIFIYFLSYRSYFILLISVTWAILEVGAAPVVIFATLDTPKFRNFLAQEFKLMNHCHYIYIHTICKWV